MPTELAVGPGIFEIVREFDLAKLRQQLDRVATSGETSEWLEVEYDSIVAAPKSYLLNAQRMASSDGGLPLILLAIEDMSEKQDAEDAVRRLNEELENRVRQRTAQLEAANRELEAFCYSVGHDLRAPLRAIDGFAQELYRSCAGRLDDQGRHYLQRVRSNSQRMAYLIDALLHLSHLSRVKMRYAWVDLST